MAVAAEVMAAAGHKHWWGVSGGDDDGAVRQPGLDVWQQGHGRGGVSLGYGVRDQGRPLRNPFFPNPNICAPTRGILNVPRVSSAEQGGGLGVLKDGFGNCWLGSIGPQMGQRSEKGDGGAGGVAGAGRRASGGAPRN